MRYKKLMLQDVGGLLNEANRKIRRGLLYRSGDLYRINTRELEQVRALGIKQVIDLRQEEMIRQRPDSFTAPRVVNLPVRLGQFEQLNLRDALRRRVDWSLYDFEKFYILILEENKDYICRFLELLVEGPRPVLLHCTAGKDRTGVFIAVLLLCLRVPRPRVVQWYLSIERHLKTGTPAWAKFLVWYSRTPKETVYLNRAALDAALDHIEHKYRGIDGYLAAGGFSRAGALRDIFLEE